MHEYSRLTRLVPKSAASNHDFAWLPVPRGGETLGRAGYSKNTRFAVLALAGQRFAVGLCRGVSGKPGLDNLWEELNFRGYQSVQNAHNASIGATCKHTEHGYDVYATKYGRLA